MLKHIFRYCLLIFPVLCIPGCAALPQNTTYDSNTSLTVTYFGEVVHTRNPKYVSVEDFSKYIGPAGQKRIIFAADWCKSCEQLRNDLQKWDLGKNVVWVNVDERWVQSMLGGLEISGVPTLLVVETPKKEHWAHYSKRSGRGMIVLWLLNNKR